MELINRRNTLELGCVVAVRGFHVPAEVGDGGGAEETKDSQLEVLSAAAPSVGLGGHPELLSLQRPETRAVDDPTDSEYPYVLVSSCLSHGFL